MKIAFVGKGGSGKSSASWLFIQSLSSLGNKIIAIDADYNMDLAHSLGWLPELGVPQLHESEKDFYTHLGLEDDALFREIPYRDELGSFTLSPKDTFTKKYTHRISESVDVMVTGGHTDEMIYSNRCTHAFIAPLKFYIPLLRLGADEMVVVDSVAGTDMVGYGLYAGADVIVIVVENTTNSLRVFTQIKDIAEKLGIPHLVLLNKWSGEEIPSIIDPSTVAGIIQFDLGIAKLDPNKIIPENKKMMHDLAKRIHPMKKEPKELFERVRALQEERDAH